jgi:hypothetical protein
MSPYQLALKIALALCGLGVVALGINVGFGGIETLGLQAPKGFVAIVDASAFATQDSHVRFLGGLFLAMGLVLVAGAIWTGPLRQVLTAICLVLFAGGLVRLAGGGDTVATNPALFPSLVFELVVFPGLAFALWRLKQGKKELANVG